MRIIFKVSHFCTISLLLILHGNPLSGFSIKQTGYSFIKNYTKETYKAATQNWEIVQDNRGIMYFANSSGLLQFDGEYWKLFPLPNNSMVRAVCIDKDNKVWAGGFNQLGYFEFNKYGEFQFESVVNLLEPQYRDFGDIWKIFRDNDRLLIQTFSAILEYKNGLLHPLVWDADIHYSFLCAGRLYVKVNGKGLYQLVNSELIKVLNSEIFADQVISAVLPYTPTSSLIITATNGIFLMENQLIKPVRSDVGEFLKKSQVFDAILQNGYYFIGTVQSGLLILDMSLNPVQHLDRYRGLQNNTILALFIDREENLWLGLDNGIDYVKINSPLSLLANKHEAGAGYQSVLYDNKLFLGSNQGLFYIDWNAGKGTIDQNQIIKPVRGMQGQVWMLKVFQNNLYCGHDKGTFIINGTSSTQIADIAGAANMQELPGTNLVVQGTYSGLIILQKNPSPGKPYIFRNKVEGFNNSGKNLIIDKSNNIWIGHGYKGIYRLTLSTDYRKVYKQKHYGKDQGLPENFGLNLLSFDEQLVVSCKYGFFYYNQEKDYFLPFDPLNKTFEKETVHAFYSDPGSKNTWFFSDKRMGILKPNFDGTFTIEHIPFIDLNGKFLSGYESLYFLNSTNVIVASEDGFVHFDPTFRKKYYMTFPTLIGEVTFSSDSTALIGISKDIKATANEPKINHRYNSLKIRYSAPFYDSPKPLEFTYILEGFDKIWSDWTESTEKEYTNLAPGKYIFRVKARNNYGFEGEQDSLIFEILPPWYRSVVAYIFYLLIGLVLLSLLVWYILRRFEKEKHALRAKQMNEMKEREKEYERESLKAEQEIIKLRNEKLEIDNQRKQSEIENKTKELAAIAMQITYKNEMLTKVRQKLSKVTQKMIHQESKQQVEALIKTLEKDMVRDDEWEKFELSFDQVHEDFLKKLRTTFSDLSPKDLKLCAYLRMNLSSKEIAPLLNISIRGVEISRYRLRRKLDIDRDKNLTEFMMNF